MYVLCTPMTLCTFWALDLEAHVDLLAHAQRGNKCKYFCLNQRAVQGTHMDGNCYPCMYSDLYTAVPDPAVSTALTHPLLEELGQRQVEQEHQHPDWPL